MAALKYLAVLPSVFFLACEVLVACDPNGPPSGCPEEAGYSCQRDTATGGGLCRKSIAVTTPPGVKSCLGASPTPLRVASPTAAFATAVGITPTPNGKTVFVGDPGTSLGTVFSFPAPFTDPGVMVAGPATLAAGSQFGAALAVSSTNLLVGAPGQKASAFLYSLGDLTKSDTLPSSILPANTVSLGNAVALASWGAAVSVKGVPNGGDKTDNVLLYPLTAPFTPSKIPLSAVETVEALAMHEKFLAVSVSEDLMLNQVILFPPASITPYFIQPQTTKTGFGQFGLSLALSTTTGFPTVLAAGVSADTMDLDFPGFTYQISDAGHAQALPTFFGPSTDTTLAAFKLGSPAAATQAIAFAQNYFAVGVPAQNEVWIYAWSSTQAETAAPLMRLSLPVGGFGTALASSGNTLVVGAQNGNGNGQAFVYCF